MPARYAEELSFGGKQRHLRCRSLVALLHWAAFAGAVEELPGWLLHSSHSGCDGALPLEAACATETAAHTAAPLLSCEVRLLCQALRTVWGWGDGS